MPFLNSLFPGKEKVPLAENYEIWQERHKQMWWGSESPEEPPNPEPPEWMVSSAQEVELGLPKCPTLPKCPWPSFQNKFAPPSCPRHSLMNEFAPLRHPGSSIIYYFLVIIFSCSFSILFSPEKKKCHSQEMYRTLAGETWTKCGRIEIEPPE